MTETFVSTTDTYEADAPFAEGASGLAHRATSARLGRRVFLKQLKLAGARDWKAVELFEREAKVLAGLDHPAIPRYLDFFRDEQRGSFILVQELIDAPSLQDLLREQRPLAPEQLRAIVEQALAVLDYLHTRVPPVLHRDISPKNFLLRGDTLFLVDFGAVKLSLRDSTVMTSAGTFGYMAPEQILGQAVPASDLYGLGMCVVALATHADPSSLPLDPRRGGIDLAQVLPQIPADLRRVVEALVKPGLADRVASARDALALLRAPPPVPAPPPKPRLTLAERVRRRPRLAAFTAVLALYCSYTLLASLFPMPGQTGQLGGWTSGHTQLLAQLPGNLVGDYDLFVSPNDIEALAFSPDGALLASADRDKILLWDVATGDVVRTLEGPRSGAGWLRFGETGETLWAVDMYGNAWFRWTTATGAVEQQTNPEMLPDAAKGAEVLDIGVRGARSLTMLVRTYDTSRLLIYRSDGDDLAIVPLDLSAPTAAVSGDGRIVALAESTRHTGESELGVFAVRRVEDGELLGRFSMRYATRVALSPDGRTVALIGDPGVALHRLGEAEPGPPVTFNQFTYGGEEAAFSADGARLVVSRGNHAFAVDVATRRLLRHVEYDDTELDYRPISAAALSADGTRLALGNKDELVRLWPLE